MAMMMMIELIANVLIGRMTSIAEANQTRNSLDFSNYFICTMSYYSMTTPSFSVVLVKT